MLALFLLLLAQFTVPSHTGALAASGGGGGKTQIFTDSFPYAGGDLVANAGGNWTYTLGTSVFYVDSPNASIYNLNAGTGIAEWTGTGYGTASANQYTTGTYLYVGAAETGIAVRVSGSSAYFADCKDLGCKIVKIVSGTPTELTTYGSTLSNGAVVEFDVTGTAPAVLTVYVNGASYSSYTDSSSPLTTGSWGVVSYYGGSSPGGTELSNVKGGNL
jgi:hypothetical protein